MSILYKPKEHEYISDVKPVAVHYECEYCHEGEMIYDRSSLQKVVVGGAAPMFKHICNKCNKVLMLNEIYPKIEWIEPEDSNKENE